LFVDALSVPLIVPVSVELNLKRRGETLGAFTYDKGRERLKAELDALVESRRRG